MNRYKEIYIGLTTMNRQPGWYFVELKQNIKLEIDDPDYFKDWRFWDGEAWERDEYSSCCEVTAVLHGEE